MEKLRLKLIREALVIGLYQYILIKDNSDDVINYLKNHDELKKNREEVEYVVKHFENIISNEENLKVQIQSNLKEGWTNDRLSKMELSILYVSVYEMTILNSNKEIVINEAVLLTKKYCDDGSYKYVNGVLNKF